MCLEMNEEISVSLLLLLWLWFYNKVASDDIQPEKPDGLVLLTEENFERRIYQGGMSKAGFDYFVKFYANGSPVNTDFDPVWNKLAKEFRNSRDVKIAEFECKAEQRSRFCGDRNIPIGKRSMPLKNMTCSLSRYILAAGETVFLDQ